MKVKAKIFGGIAIASMAVSAILPWNKVIRVLDGDTIQLANLQRVRLLGIDAPDMAYCGGEEAKKELEKMVLGKKVRLEEIKVDKFERLLALAYVGDVLVNEKILESGWARWDGTRNNLGDKMSLASNTARDSETGVWGKCHWKLKECRIKGNIEKRSGKTSGGRKMYFFPGCSEYDAVVVERELGENWFCSEEDALRAGYEKAANCFGKVYNEE